MPDEYLLSSLIFWRVVDGVVKVTIKEGAEVCLNDAIDAQAILKERFLSTHLKMAFLIDVSNIRSISKDARDLFSSLDVNGSVSAIGILTGSKFGRVISNFFLATNQLKVPIKLFLEEKLALDWLGQHSATESDEHDKFGKTAQRTC